MDKNLRALKLRAELNRITEILRTQYFPEEVILFGSFAQERIDESSDIDLVIIKQTNKRFIDRIGEVIELCHPKMAVDFIVYTPEEFCNLKKEENFIKEEVIGKGKVIYERRQ